MARKAHSPAANKAKRELEAMRAQLSKASGVEQQWDATELGRIDLLVDQLDARAELQALYEQAEDPALKLKLATEIRLAAGQAARLLKELQPKATTTAAKRTTPRTSTGRRAQYAANRRWQNVGA